LIIIDFCSTIDSHVFNINEMLCAEVKVGQKWIPWDRWNCTVRERFWLHLHKSLPERRSAAPKISANFPGREHATRYLPDPLLLSDVHIAFFTVYVTFRWFPFTARRVGIPQAMPWQDVRPSVCPSVRHTPIFCRNG